jgi:hypothetical protein
VTEDLVPALRRALELLEAEAAAEQLDTAAHASGATPAPGTAPVPPAPREPIAEDLGTTLRRKLAAGRTREVISAEILQDVEPECSARVLAKIEAVRLELIAQVDSIPQEEDLRWALALSYIELKAQWVRREVRASLEESTLGSSSQEVTLEAAAVSYLMGLIEPLLDQDHLLRIQELFIAQAAD